MLQLKGTFETKIGFTTSGRIFINQYAENHKDIDTILLSPDQFRQLYQWFSENECAIEQAWNIGRVKDDSEA